MTDLNTVDNMQETEADLADFKLQVMRFRARKDDWVLAMRIAKGLQERKWGMLLKIYDIVWAFGPEKTKALVDEAYTIQENGGMLTSDQKPKTTGGILITVARQHAETEAQRIVSSYKTKEILKLRKERLEFWKAEEKAWEAGRAARRAAAERHKAEIAPKLAERAKRRQRTKIQRAMAAMVWPPFVWDERRAIFELLMKAKGRASSVKITVVGRPVQVENRKDLTIVLFQQTHKLPLTVPKGVPQPPAEPTNYVVYIGAKQWRTVVPALDEDPTAELVMEGYSAYEPALPGIAVYATQVKLKPVKKDKQKEAQAPTEQSESAI